MSEAVEHHKRLQRQFAVVMRQVGSMEEGKIIAAWLRRRLMMVSSPQEAKEILQYREGQRAAFALLLRMLEGEVG